MKKSCGDSSNQRGGVAQYFPRERRGRILLGLFYVGVMWKKRNK